MIYSCLAAAALIASAYGQLADNVAINGGNLCKNYIRMDYTNLYPVGRCYSENTYEEQVAATNSPYSGLYTQNMMYKCEANTNGTGNMACLYRMGAGCNGQVYEENMCYPCNGADDQCECEVGGDANECDLYEMTSYDETFSWNGIYCDKKGGVTMRSVVNMCIQGSSGVDQGGSISTYAYECGGYDYRSGQNQDYIDDYNYHTTADCGGNSVPSPTNMPTETTASPTLKPTLEGESNGDSLYCDESTCDGVAGPRADGVDRQSVVVAMAFAVIASLL